MLIDTPGMRELGDRGGRRRAAEAFADVEAVLGGCRFRDCRHQGEPGCAVKAAIAGGRLTQERWESYMALKDEVCYADDKAAYRRQNSRSSRTSRGKTGSGSGRITVNRPAPSRLPAGMRGPGRAGGGRERAPQPLSELPVQPPCG